MSKLDDLLKQHADATRTLSEVNRELREATGLPHGWSIDTTGGPMAGGVALYGPNCDHNREEEDRVTISVSSGSQYGKVFSIWDHERGTSSVWVDPEAVRAAMRIYDMREAEDKEARDKKRAGR